MEKLTPGQSLRSILGICEDLCNVTSSPASPDGLSPSGSPDGEKIEKYGLGQFHVSHFPAPGERLEGMTRGTFGPTFTGSLAPVILQSSWENRLVVRLGMLGSTESALIWKVKTTPAGQLISRLAPSTRHTSETGCIGWPTPLPNPSNADGKSYLRRKRRKPNGAVTDLGALVKSWPTPKASDCEGGRTTKTKGGGNSHLPIHVREAISGLTPNGCMGLMENRGALNPEFVSWLMGYPPEHYACAPSETPSFLNLRWKS